VTSEPECIAIVSLSSLCPETSTASFPDDEAPYPHADGGSGQIQAFRDLPTTAARRSGYPADQSELRRCNSDVFQRVVVKCNARLFLNTHLARQTDYASKPCNCQLGPDWHYPHYGNRGGTPGSSVRMGDHKLIEFFEDGHVELYNLREDVGENLNLAAENRALARQMKDVLADWRERIKAKIPQPNPDWNDQLN